MLEIISVVLAIVLTEVILSLDNAVVLAQMVKHLPKQEQKKALTYGILGAYLFRGVSLFFVVWLSSIAWVKIIGGVYLLYVVFKYFKGFREDEDNIDSYYGFWGTVILVELMDMVFSIDNILGAVAFLDNIYIIIVGVFIGILAIRFAAGKLVVLLDKFPALETAAHLVIGILGIKLIGSYFYPHIFENSIVSIGTSILTLAIFGSSLLINKKR